MEMRIEELEDGVTKVVLRGRLDIAGASVIDLGFSAVSGSRRAILVDLSDVSFLASLGIRVLVLGAKTVASKGGRIVLFAPIPDVESVLTTMRIDSLIPIYHDQPAARRALTE